MIFVTPAWLQNVICYRYHASGIGVKFMGQITHIDP